MEGALAGWLGRLVPLSGSGLVWELGKVPGPHDHVGDVGSFVTLLMTYSCSLFTARVVHFGALE